MSRLLSIRSAFRRSLQQATLQHAVVRCCSLGNPIRFEKAQRAFQKKDGVQPEYELIYRNTMEHYVTIGSIVVKTAALVCTAFILYRVCFIEESFFDMFFVTTQNNMRVANGPKEVIAFIAVSYFLLGLLLVVVNRLALRIYNHGDKYVAVFAGKLPFTYDKVAFTVNEVIAPTASERPFKFAEKPFRLAGRKAVLIEEYFRKPADIFKLISRRDFG